MKLDHCVRASCVQIIEELTKEWGRTEKQLGPLVLALAVAQEELSAMTKERDDHITITHTALNERDEYLKQLDAMTKERDGWKALQYPLYYQPLHEAQAKNKELRAALEIACKYAREYEDAPFIEGEKALAANEDTTALDRALKEAKVEVLREAANEADRVAKYVPSVAGWLRRMTGELDQLTPTYMGEPMISKVEKQQMALENCRLLAARHRKEDWALLILGFCAEGGVVGRLLK